MYFQRNHVVLLGAFEDVLLCVVLVFRVWEEVGSDCLKCSWRCWLEVENWLYVFLFVASLVNTLLMGKFKYVLLCVVLVFRVW